MAWALMPGETLACTPYPPDRDSRVPNCAIRRSDGEIRALPAGLKALAFDKHGVAAMIVDDAFYYVARSGRAARALPFDNGPDEFVEGLARTIRGGKVGYIDRRLREAIPPDWDFAFPFRNGVAVVCTGCRERKEGEHSLVAGGKWGYIDRAGRTVIPVVHPRDALPGPGQAALEAKRPR
jgi:hypothetical protein